VIAVLACAWAGLAAAPFVVWAARAPGAERSRSLRRRRRPQGRRTRWPWSRAIARVAAVPPIASAARVARAPLRARRARRRDDDLARELAVAVDLVGVGVAAGCTPYLAVELGARWAPPRVQAEFETVTSNCALGLSFDDALRDLGLRVRSMRPLTDTLRSSARLGAPAAPALVRVANEVRADLRRRAEARARTVPVRLCFPLVGCILPAFALLTVVPVVLDGLHG